MDDVEKEVISTVVTTTMGPITDVIRDAIGGTVGDRLKAWRQSRPAWQKLNAEQVADRAFQKLKDRGAKVSTNAAPEAIEEVLESAARSSSDKLKEMFAGLLAAIMDDGRRESYRSEFTQIVSEMESLDAELLLKVRGDTGEYSTNQRSAYAQRFQVNEDQVELSMLNLIRLKLAMEPGHPNSDNMTTVNRIALRPLGREIVRLVT